MKAKHSPPGGIYYKDRLVSSSRPTKTVSMTWFSNWWLRLKFILWLKRVWNWFDLSMCYKQRQGYNCRHSTMSNGQKECVEPPNYWRDSDYD